MTSSRAFRMLLLCVGVPALLALGSGARGGEVEPPWLPPPAGGQHFTVRGVDDVPDLYGDVVDPDLVVFFAGNQFMVVPDLMAAFRKAHPQVRRIFVETLPPGILAAQIEKGSLVVGNLRIALAPDVFTAGAKRMRELSGRGWFTRTLPYARNRLAIMVARGNPKRVRSLEDLASPQLRVSMPNPAWEGIGGLIVQAYEKAGGKALRQAIMVKKVRAGTTFLTHIHHRQTPIRIMRGESDAGPVWLTEARFQQGIGNPIDLVHVLPDQNVEATYVAGAMRSAPHPRAASDFLDFLGGPAAQAIYRRYGFEPPPSTPDQGGSGPPAQGDEN